MKEVTTIVIDNRTYMMKSGFSGDEAPRSVFPTVVGSKILNFILDIFKGKHIWEMKPIEKEECNLINPMSKGEIIDMELKVNI